MEPRYSCIAYYNKQNARDDIQAAMDSLDLYIAEVSAVAQLAGIVTKTENSKIEKWSTKVRKKKCLILMLRLQHDLKSFDS